MAKVTIQTVSCPQCGKSFGTASEYLYGSPLRTCDKCGKVFVDRRYHELALEQARDEDISLSAETIAQKKKSAVKYLAIGGGLIVLGIALAFVIGLIAAAPFVFGVVFIIGGFSDLKASKPRNIEKKRAELQLELQYSIQRMQDPQYVQTLRQVGYNIPYDFYPRTTLD